MKRHAADDFHYRFYRFYLSDPATLVYQTKEGVPFVRDLSSLPLFVALNNPALLGPPPAFLAAIGADGNPPSLRGEDLSCYGKEFFTQQRERFLYGEILGIFPTEGKFYYVFSSFYDGWCAFLISQGQTPPQRGREIPPTQDLFPADAEEKTPQAAAPASPMPASQEGFAAAASSTASSAAAPASSSAFGDAGRPPWESSGPWPGLPPAAAFSAALSDAASGERAAISSAPASSSAFGDAGRPPWESSGPWPGLPPAAISSTSSSAAAPISPTAASSSATFSAGLWALPDDIPKEFPMPAASEGNFRGNFQALLGKFRLLEYMLGIFEDSLGKNLSPVININLFRDSHGNIRHLGDHSSQIVLFSTAPMSRGFQKGENDGRLREAEGFGKGALAALPRQSLRPSAKPQDFLERAFQVFGEFEADLADALDDSADFPPSLFAAPPNRF